MTATATAIGTGPDTAAAVSSCLAGLDARLPRPPAHVVVTCPAHQAEEVARLVAQARPGVAIHGLTTCLGPSTAAGVTAGGIGMFAIADDDGAFGSSCQPMRGDPRKAAEHAAIAATAAAGRPGELPTMVLLSATPGCEETVLAGIADALGPHVPIVGGSAADDAVRGQWSVWNGDQSAADGIVVSAWFPACRVATGFHSGYAPAGINATVTSAEGRRLRSIDGEPAAAWYDRVTGGRIGWVAGTERSVLAETTLAPLARQVGGLGVPQHQLSHPARCLADGSLVLFTAIAPGDTIHLMHGSRESLVERAGRVVAGAIGLAGGGAPLGSVLVYCAGCMLAAPERMPDVMAGVTASLAGAPCLGLHTFGEQGGFIDGSVRHGNLMISSAVLLP